MKRILVIMIFLIILVFPNTVQAEEQAEILKEQEETYGISKFIDSSQKYTEDAFEDINLKDIYKSALTGNVNTKGIMGGILKILGTEVTKTIQNLGYILVIIVIHSIIKSISEGMGNEQIGEITYYVQYILIVTLIMTNFTDTVTLIKDTINNLVGFINSLLPILLALMITTRKFSYCIYCATSTFIDNYIYWKFHNKCAFTTYTNKYSSSGLFQKYLIKYR